MPAHIMSMLLNILCKLFETPLVSMSTKSIPYWTCRRQDRMKQDNQFVNLQLLHWHVQEEWNNILQNVIHHPYDQMHIRQYPKRIYSLLVLDVDTLDMTLILEHVQHIDLYIGSFNGSYITFNLEQTEIHILGCCSFILCQCSSHSPSNGSFILQTFSGFSKWFQIVLWREVLL